MNPQTRVLLFDDNLRERRLLRRILEQQNCGFVVTEAASRSELEARLAKDNIELLLSDLNVRGLEFRQMLDFVRARFPSVTVLIVARSGSEEAAIEALKRGAADYVTKTPRRLERLPQAILSALETRRRRDERARAGARSEEALLKLNQQLERLFQERTAELAAASVELNRCQKKLESPSYLKTQFLASMGHELRTPLNSVIGFSDLLAEEGAGPLTEKQRRFVENIRASAAHLLVLVGKLLAFLESKRRA